MALLVPNNGKGDALAAVLAKTPAEDLTLRLFKSNITPADTDTAATYNAQEATFTGYAAVPLTAASWVIVEADPTTGTYPQVAFTSSADQAVETIYGYYLTRNTSGRIAWAESFGVGYPIKNNADTINVTPKHDYDSI